MNWDVPGSRSSKVPGHTREQMMGSPEKPGEQRLASRGGRRPPTLDATDEFPDYAPRAIGGSARTPTARTPSSRVGTPKITGSVSPAEGKISLVRSRSSLPDALQMDSPGAKQLADGSHAQLQRYYSHQIIESAKNHAAAHRPSTSASWRENRSSRRVSPEKPTERARSSGGARLAGTQGGRTPDVTEHVALHAAGYVGGQAGRRAWEQPRLPSLQSRGTPASSAVPDRVASWVDNTLPGTNTSPHAADVWASLPIRPSTSGAGAISGTGTKGQLLEPLYETRFETRYVAAGAGNRRNMEDLGGRELDLSSLQKPIDPSSVGESTHIVQGKVPVSPVNVESPSHVATPPMPRGFCRDGFCNCNCFAQDNRNTAVADAVGLSAFALGGVGGETSGVVCCGGGLFASCFSSGM